MHLQQCKVNDSLHEMLSESVISSAHEHRFLFTILRGTGTFLRVGVATEGEPRSSWALRLSDGRLETSEPLTFSALGRHGSSAASRAPRALLFPGQLTQVKRAPHTPPPPHPTCASASPPPRRPHPPLSRALRRAARRGGASR